MFDTNLILELLIRSGISRASRARLEWIASGGPGFCGGALHPAGADPNRPDGTVAATARALLGGGGEWREGGGVAPARADAAPGRSGSASRALALLSGLATVALQQAMAGAAAGGLAEPPMARFIPQNDGIVLDDEGRAEIMIRAMINAAKAGGQTDAMRTRRILAALDEAGADPKALQFVRDEMAGPLDVEAVVGAVDSEQTALEVYAASLFAIPVDTPREVAYLRQLGERLGLDPALTGQLHQSFEIDAVD